VAKYDRNGVLQWARKAPGPGTGVGQTVAADPYGDIFATSYKHDYGVGTFLTKYDPSGTVLWYRTAAISCCTGDYMSGTGLAVDAFGNPIVAGYGTGNIENFPSTFSGGYVVRFRSDGARYSLHYCATVATSRTGPAGVAMDNAGNAIIAGRFISTSLFGTPPGTSSNLVSAGGNDAFLVKLGLRPPAIISQPSHRLVTAGSNATLQVTSANSPVLYQWQLNGTNLAGATNSSLSLNNFNFTKAGRYSVVIQGAGDSTTSSVAGVGMIPVLSMAPASNGVALNWDGMFTLQSASSVMGSYSDQFTGAGPVTNLFAPGEFERYFRLRVPSPDVSGGFTSENFALNFLGSPGRRYTVQTSTNLLNWTTVTTDVFPFTYQDTNSAIIPQKFYRTLLIP
jgi:hypothetical protein